MKLYPVKVGTRFFDSHPVRATDPGYDTSDKACYIDGIDIHCGYYDCVAWKGRQYFTDCDGKRYGERLVFVCGIYLSSLGYDVSGLTRHEIGCIGVDAGMAGFFQHKPDYDEDGWYDFCNKMYKRDSLITNEGFCTSSGYGDGVYPVYAYTDKSGETVALEIAFVE